jgi:hypothetical protein
MKLNCQVRSPLGSRRIRIFPSPQGCFLGLIQHLQLERAVTGLVIEGAKCAGDPGARSSALSRTSIVTLVSWSMFSPFVQNEGGAPVRCGITYLRQCLRTRKILTTADGLLRPSPLLLIRRRNAQP